MAGIEDAPITGATAPPARGSPTRRRLLALLGGVPATQRLREWPATRGKGDAFAAVFVSGLMNEAADALATPAPPPVAVPDNVREAFDRLAGTATDSRHYEGWLYDYRRTCGRWVDTLIAAQPASPGDGAGDDASKHKIIEAADHSDRRFDWALTIAWPDGTETIEHVSDQAARTLGYRSEEAGGEVAVELSAARPSAPQAGTGEDRGSATPGASERLRGALAELEEACDRRAALLSPEAYLTLHAIPGMEEASRGLDEARRRARAAIASAPGQPTTPPAPAPEVAAVGLRDLLRRVTSLVEERFGADEANGRPWNKASMAFAILEEARAAIAPPDQQGGTGELTRSQFIVAIATAIAGAGQMAASFALPKAAEAYRAFERDNDIEFGDRGYAWDADAALTIAREYEIDHWESAAPTPPSKAEA